MSVSIKANVSGCVDGVCVCVGECFWLFGCCVCR